jgi:hypothetical protein
VVAAAGAVVGAAAGAVVAAGFGGAVGAAVGAGAAGAGVLAAGVALGPHATRRVAAPRAVPPRRNRNVRRLVRFGISFTNILPIGSREHLQSCSKSYIAFSGRPY